MSEDVTAVLTNAKKNRIRRIALNCGPPDGWAPVVGDTVFVPRIMVEYVETRDQVTGAAITVPRNATTVRPGVHVAEVVSKLVDPDLVIVREPKSENRSTLKQKIVLAKSLRPFRGWEKEIDRLPVKRSRSKKLKQHAK